jgi:hypothetical protein
MTDDETRRLATVTRRRRCAYTVSHDDGTRGRCPRMTRFEVLDGGVWTPRCDLHRRVDPGMEVRAVGMEPRPPR